MSGRFPRVERPSPFTFEEFKEWVSKQDPCEEYKYTNNFNCPVARFLKDSGLAQEPCVGSSDWCDMGARGWKTEIDYSLPKELRPMPGFTALNAKNFGELLTRLSIIDHYRGNNHGN